MNPYRAARTMRYVAAFLDAYFADNRARVLVFGINPGRFGAGLTGITFTDPVALSRFCGIPNELGTKRELSSVFIYDFIARWGGPEKFYSRFFLTAISPLGYTTGGLNHNYYDSPALQRAVTPFITRSIERHIAIGGRRDHAIVLGKGQNAKFLLALNECHRFFQRIHVLEHPRPIMQYKRKRLAAYFAAYTETFARIPADAGSF